MQHILPVQDNINMQINNLARDNLQDKLPLLADLVTNDFWPYFANYMVVKRAAQVVHLSSMLSQKAMSGYSLSCCSACCKF